MQYPRAVQVDRLVRHLDRAGLEVVCAAPTEVVAGTSTSETGVRIHRLPDGLSGRVLTKVAAVWPALAAMPDAQRLWARRAAQYICGVTALGPDDLLVTFGQPMSDHLAGLAVRRATGCRWVAHFSDPWVDNPFRPQSPLAHRENVRLERSVMETADALVFTSEETVDLVMAKYPEGWRARCHVLPHAFEVPAAPAEAPPRAQGPIIARYLGNFYGARTPEPLFRALALLASRTPDLAERLQVELIGQVPPVMLAAARTAGLPDGLVQAPGIVSYHESIALMRWADILLTIDALAEVSVFLPSKLIDYLAWDRPLLGLTPPGTAARLISALGGATADPNKPEDGAAALERMLALAEMRRQEAPESPWARPEVREAYAAPAVARRMQAILNATTRAAPAVSHP